MLHHVSLPRFILCLCRPSQNRLDVATPHKPRSCPLRSSQRSVEVRTFRAPCPPSAVGSATRTWTCDEDTDLPVSPSPPLRAARIPVAVHGEMFTYRKKVLYTFFFALGTLSQSNLESAARPPGTPLSTIKSTGGQVSTMLYIILLYIPCSNGTVVVEYEHLGFCYFAIAASIRAS